MNWAKHRISAAVFAILSLSSYLSQSADADEVAKISLKAPVKVILNRESINVSADGSSTAKTRYEFQILDAKLADKVKTETIPLCLPFSTVRITQAFARQPDGSTIVVPDGGIITRPAKSSAAFRCPQEIVITYPELKLGSIVVRETEVRTSALFPHEFALAWKIKKFLAIEDLQIDVTVPSSMILAIDAPGVAVSRVASQNATIYRFHYAHPSLVSSIEDFQSSRATSPGIYISSFKSYSDLAKAMGAMFYPKVVVTPAIQEKADQIVASVHDRREKAKRIHDWVKMNIHYALGPWEDRAPREASVVLSTGKGDCKDQAVLLAALLEAEGIATEFVFLDTVDGSFLPKVPVVWGIVDHVITYLPEFHLYQDTTWADATFGDLPLIANGRVGFLVGRDSGKTIQFPGEIGAGLDRLRSFNRSTQ